MTYKAGEKVWVYKRGKFERKIVGISSKYHTGFYVEQLLGDTVDWELTALLGRTKKETLRNVIRNALERARYHGTRSRRYGLHARILQMKLRKL